MLLALELAVPYVLLTPLVKATKFGRSRALGPSDGNKRVCVSVIARGGWIEQLFLVAGTVMRFAKAYTYEEKVAGAMLRVRGETFLDIGAHHGSYCCLLRRNFRTVIAVEPSPDSIRVMRRTFRLSGVRAIVIPAAVSDQVGSTKLFLAKSGSVENQIELGEYPSRTREELRVPTTTVSKIIECYGPVDLVKVDVEGAEWLLLKGAESALDQVHRWVIELHDIRRKEELERWMTAHRYRGEWLDENHFAAWRTEHEKAHAMSKHPVSIIY
jgi:FkbM family methyltransferase